MRAHIPTSSALTSATRNPTGARIGRGLLAVSFAAASLVAVAAPATAAVSDCNGSNGVTVTSLNPATFYIDTGISPALDAGYAGYDVTSAGNRDDLWVKLSGFTGGALGLQSGQPDSLALGPVTAAGHTPAFFLLAASGESASPQGHTVTVYSGKPGNASATLLCSTPGGFTGVDETIKASANKLATVDPVTLSTATPVLGSTVSVSISGVTGVIGAGTAADPNGLYMTPTALSSFPAAAFRLIGTSLHISPDGNAPAQTFSNLLHLAPLDSTARAYLTTYTFAITATTSTDSRLYPIQQIASGTQIKHTDTSSFDTLIPPIPPVTNPMTVTLVADPTALPLAGGTSQVTETLVSTGADPSTIDQLQAQLPAGISYAAGTATVNGAPVADPTVNGATLSFSGPFSAHSGAPTRLRFDVTAGAGAATYQITGAGLLGQTVIDTTSDTSDDVPATATLTVAAPKAQSIDFPVLSDTALDATAPTPAATATSGLDVIYSSSTSAVCTVTASGVVSLVGVGTCTIIASQPGNDAWTAATAVSRSFEVTPAAPAPPPAPPQPGPETSSGVGVTPQTTTVNTPLGGSVALLDNGTPVLTVTIPGQGTYLLDPGSGVITFTPVLGFAGPATPVTYQVTDAFDQTGAATYTPTVLVPPPPTPAELATVGAVDDVQTVTIPVPDGGSVTLVDNGVAVSTITVPGEGTYAIDPQTGVITFTPEPGFVGRADPVTYRQVDAYGQAADATYGATVSAGSTTTPTPNQSSVPAPATASPATASPAGASPAGAPLASTGLDTGVLSALAAALLALGAVVSLTGRRRRPRH